MSAAKHLDDMLAEDCADRLVKLVPFKQLHPACRTAGEQLEWMTPATIGRRTDGKLYAGPAVTVPRMTMFYLIADAKRVAVLGMQMANIKAVAESVDYMRERAHQDPIETPVQTRVVAAMNFILDRWGDKPNGKRKLEADINQAEVCLGLLLAPLDIKQREKLIRFIEASLEANICPAIVGVIGPASSGKPDLLSIAWPMLLPVAPYAEAALA